MLGGVRITIVIVVSIANTGGSLRMDKEQTIMNSNPSPNGKKDSKCGDDVTASSPATSAEEYKVGPGRPPKEYQYKPGQSGNPKGAKRKEKSLLPDLKRLFEQALSEKVTLKQGNKERTLTMAAAGFKQLAAQHAKGDRHARRDVLTYAQKLGIDLMAGQRKAIEEAVAEAARASTGYTLSEELLDRLSERTLDEIISVEQELQAEKKNLKKMH
jgi:hypothetical protein